MKAVILVGSLIFSACGIDGIDSIDKDKKKDKSGNSGEVGSGGGFLTDSDLQAGSQVKKSSRSEVETMINAKSFLSSEDLFLTGKTSSHQNDQKTDNCFTKLFEDVKVTATKDTATIDADVNASECLAKTNKNLKDTEVQIRYYFRLTCDNTDLSELDGKSVNDLENDENSLCKKSSEASIKSHSETISGFTSKAGKKSTRQKTRTLSALVGKDGGACSYTLTKDTWKKADGCKETTRTIINESKEISDEGEKSLDNEGEETFLQFVYEDFEGSRKDAKDVSGKIAFVYNNWEGDITLTEGQMTFKLQGNDESSSSESNSDNESEDKSEDENEDETSAQENEAAYEYDEVEADDDYGW